jgi:hypothetical protein
MVSPLRAHWMRIALLVSVLLPTEFALGESDNLPGFAAEK